MKLKSGFTLVELIAGIAVLAIITAIITAGYSGIKNSVLDRQYLNLKIKIEDAAEKYARETSIVTVSVAKLIETGFLKPDKGFVVYNPKNNESLNCNIVEVSVKNGKYTGELSEKSISHDGNCDDYVMKINNLIIIECIGTVAEIKKCENAANKTGVWYTGAVKLSANDSIKGIANYRWTSLTGSFSNDAEVIVKTQNTLSTIYTLNVMLENDKSSTYNKLVQIDNETSKIINIDNNDNWSNKDKTIIITASDGVGSGVEKYYIGTNNTCPDNEFQTSEKKALDNGTYYVCVLDMVGNKSAPHELTVKNIDKNPPIIANIVKDPAEPAASVTISTTITDNESGIVAYAINKNDKVENVTWTNISEVKEKTISQPITASGTYYIWAKDKTGNVSNKSIEILSIMPVITNIKINPSTWTKNNVTISADIQSNGSSIQGHSINLYNCGTFTTSSATAISKAVSTNGNYSICVKDQFGNIVESKINITNIDKTAPAIANITKSTEAWVSSLTINTTITDNESKITAYAVNQTSNSASVTWTNIAETAKQNVSHTVTANGTYYIWVKDKVGNINNRSILIKNIGVLKTISFSSGDLSSHTYNKTYNTGYQIVAIKSVTSNNGYVSGVSHSGSKVYLTVSNGNYYTKNRQSTCSTAASYTSRKSTTSCNRYYCPYGGTISGTTCTGRSWKGEGYNDYECRSGGWVPVYYSQNVNCATGYTRSSTTCESPPTHYCSNNGARWRIICSAWCYWRGNYAATCQSEKTTYYCPSGYTEYGSGCYRCSTGSLSGKTCYYSCQETYYYYNYYITIEIYV